MPRPLLSTNLYNDANLLAYWSLDSNFNATKGTYNLTSSGTVTTTTDGQFSGCATFGGGYLSNAALPNFAGTAEFSLGCWINPSNSTQSHYMLSKQDGGARNFEFRVTATTGVVFFSNSTGSADVTSTGTIPANKYSFIVATRGTVSSGNNKIYINGVLDTSQTNCGPNGTPTSSLFLGAAGPTPTIPMAGRLDDAFIFNRVLTADEVQSLYLSGGSFLLGMV